MAISDYSTTAASNTSISGIDISGTTGKVKDGDNAIRQIMADIKAGVPYLSGTNYLMESTDAGATAGPVLEFYRNSATPAASDILGNITFNGEDSAGNTQEYASIETVIVDATSTSEDGQLDFYVTKAGTRTKFASMTATATAFTGAAEYTFDATISAVSTDAGASVGPILDLYRNSASPAASDDLGQIIWNGEDDAGNKQEFANVTARISDPASGSEDGALLFRAHKAGATTNYLFIGLNAAGTATANAVGLPLGRLSFPATQNASSDANTLDDYEEGQTNPSITATTGTFTSVSCTLDYVKVGKHVSCSFSITVTTNGTAAGVIKLPLPFAATANRYGGGGYSSGGHGFVISPYDASTAAILKYDGTYGAGTGQILYGSLTYVAAN